ncbi:hypothetical protein METHB2_440010 [Candidatus Methylobacter favarea]|uniref:Resolvase HTH domain-containing protein n=1 Tax=Candidatus Methylobacter favarea TaxID=2707345 RepID=A0A8S0X8V1_9GAMM|nr:hypothetical protein METHB2_440010 [Candidatus Methylobacter favarea]
MTDSKIEFTQKLLANGVPPRDVAKNLGVSVPTLYRWSCIREPISCGSPILTGRNIIIDPQKLSACDTCSRTSCYTEIQKFGHYSSTVYTNFGHSQPTLTSSITPGLERFSQSPQEFRKDVSQGSEAQSVFLLDECQLEILYISMRGKAQECESRCLLSKTTGLQIFCLCWQEPI